MKKILLVLVMLSALFVVGCNENQRAKQFGGEVKIDLPANTKFVNATWKEDEIWYVYRPRRADEPKEVYTFQEQSSYGLLEGKVTFTEK